MATTRVTQEAREFDAAIAEQVAAAVARADFSSASLPDFAAATPDPRRILAELAARTPSGTPEADRIRQAWGFLPVSGRGQP